ncbi:ABC transporter permease [Siccirubricoccus sp. KC 17139]|uniref:ABC transporter permease n=1 Tax=Siccirubricoccus soli TaxID=2899147 RepID=A0ABT1CZ86_9PROT|nr:ABC transporter permease [Siccirubricoccus soli]MCO6414972.1 ABC transporter permease [Siccirubricoccus soli]MCP2681103.1 ABC transporter permease [Siccirubricoccus soli]
MARLVAWRLPQIAVTLLLLSALTWLAMGLMPGDPLDLAMLGDPTLSAADVAKLRAVHGLDRPLHERYLAWAAAVLRGDFGYSRLFSVRAGAVLWPALLSTLTLLGWSLLLAAAGGVLLGVLGAARPWLGRAADALSILAQSTPSFWLGLMLIILFAVTLGWLPAGGVAEAPGWWEAARFLLLPVTTLALVNSAGYARHALAAMQAELAAPYIRTARMKGLPERAVLWRHAFPNAAIPLVTIAALDAGALVSGALVTETIFARPGMGKLIYDSIMGNDYNLALLALLLAALVTMLATLAADLLQRAIDPRLGH